MKPVCRSCNATMSFGPWLRCWVCDSKNLGWYASVKAAPPKEPKKGRRLSRPEPTVPMLVSELASEEDTPRLEMDEQGWGRALPVGTVTILTGDPGCGKSTLLLKALGTIKGTCFYASSEESAYVVGDRCKRVSGRPDIIAIHCTSIFEILSWAEKIDPDVLVIDSINMCTGVESNGSNASLEDKMESLRAFCIAHGTTAIVISHINKQGQVFGPRTLEHMSDINMVITKIEGGPLDEVRIVRGTKNRFGPTGRYGAFRHVENGLVWTQDDVEALEEQREAKKRRIDKSDGLA